MKKLFLLLLPACLMAVTASAQEVVYHHKNPHKRVKLLLPKEEVFPLNSYKRIEFTEVVRTDSVPGVTVFDRVQAWLALKTASASILLQQPHNNLIIAEITQSLRVTTLTNREYVTLRYKLFIEGRDGRYKYSITNIAFLDEYPSFGCEPFYVHQPAEEIFHIDSFYQEDGQPKDMPRRLRDALIAHRDALVGELKAVVEPPKEKNW